MSSPRRVIAIGLGVVATLAALVAAGWSATIPEDVTSSPIAICDLDDQCVKVGIDWPAQ